MTDAEGDDEGVDREPAQFPLRMTLHTIVHPLTYMASQKGVTLGYSVDFDVPDRYLAQLHEGGPISARSDGVSPSHSVLLMPSVMFVPGSWKPG